jgi:KGK domain
MNQIKQIIPDPQDVAHCPDGTFLIGDLLEILKTPVSEHKSFTEQLEVLHSELKAGGFSRDHYREKIEDFIENTDVVESKRETIMKSAENGINCSLLQPNSKGWQKGKLKICLEFIPDDEPEIPVAQEDRAELAQSPLDEIRQLTIE